MNMEFSTKTITPKSGDNNADWGQSTWKLIHIIAANYPDNPSDEEKHWSRCFFKSLGKNLPCPQYCRPDYDNLFENKIPFRNDSKKDLFYWTVDIHNAVNEKLGKPIVSYEDAELIYDIVGCPISPNTNSLKEENSGQQILDDYSYQDNNNYNKTMKRTKKMRPIKIILQDTRNTANTACTNEITTSTSDYYNTMTNREKLNKQNMVRLAIIVLCIIILALLIYLLTSNRKHNDRHSRYETSDFVWSDDEEE